MSNTLNAKGMKRRSGFNDDAQQRTRGARQVEMSMGKAPARVTVEPQASWGALLGVSAPRSDQGGCAGCFIGTPGTSLLSRMFGQSCGNLAYM